MTKPAPRSFEASTPDERMPMLLTLVWCGIKLLRDGIPPRTPTLLLLDAPTYTAVAAFMGTPEIDRVFTLPVKRNLSSNAQPITILTEEEGESRAWQND